MADRARSLAAQGKGPDPGRHQLIVYHFMLHPGDTAGCPGCSLLTVVAPAALPAIESYRDRMGWTVPWVSAAGNDFTADCGVGTGFGLSVFLRDGSDVYRTYFTSDRGGEQFVATLRYLDVTPFGRQEAWEESGHGSDAPSSWWRRHDEY